MPAEPIVKECQRRDFCLAGANIHSLREGPLLQRIADLIEYRADLRADRLNSGYDKNSNQRRDQCIFDCSGAGFVDDEILDNF
jgi:hypothetical protein